MTAQYKDVRKKRKKNEVLAKPQTSHKKTKQQSSTGILYQKLDK
jgi:hypothetical protein